MTATPVDTVYRGQDGWPLHAVAVGRGHPLVLLHGGGPDHHSLVPLASLLADMCAVVLPDVRGYGRSVCADPTRHTWSRYAEDVTALLDHLGWDDAIVGGTGIGGTIALRCCIENPSRIRAAVAISVEDIENDEDKAAETELMDRFADRIRTDGLDAAWELFLPVLQPLIGNLVRDAIPRTDPASAAAAAAIGRDRAFRSIDELSRITVPVLVVPGADARHPTELAERACSLLPAGRLAEVMLDEALRTAEDLAALLAPEIRRFVAEYG